jgi:hypothetical protein
MLCNRPALIDAYGGLAEQPFCITRLFIRPRVFSSSVYLTGDRRFGKSVFLSVSIWEDGVLPVANLKYGEALNLDLPCLLGGLEDSIQTREIKQVARSFLRNIENVVNSLVLPVFVVYWARNISRCEVEAVVNLTGKATFQDSIEPELVKCVENEFRRLIADWHRASMIEPLQEQQFMRSVRYIDGMLIEGRERLNSGFEAVLFNAIVGCWTAFEAMASDLWEAALNVHPSGLAELKGTPWLKESQVASESDEDQKENTAKTKHVNLTDLQRWRYAVSRHMGSILKIKFNFNLLAGIKNAYTVAWWEKGDQDKIKAILEHPDLDLLQAIRNLLVHKGGIVDQRLLSRITGKMNKQIDPRFAEARLHEPLVIDGSTVSHSICFIIKLSTNLMHFVDSWLRRTEVASVHDYVI